MTGLYTHAVLNLVMELWIAALLNALHGVSVPAFLMYVCDCLLDTWNITNFCNSHENFERCFPKSPKVLLLHSVMWATSGESNLLEV